MRGRVGMSLQKKEGKARSIMVVGTASSAGKSLTVAGLCRVFCQDGYLVAPFKSQNMALNSYITREGLEMGRAQVIQAEAAKVEPSVLMNPVLLKPTGDAKSQVILNGEVMKAMAAADYYKLKSQLKPHVQKAYDTLAQSHDIIVLEGAGSPAEINLKQDDFVNMGMAKMADAPVLLVGDIDRGGVFASLYGTVELLEPEERARIKGIIINKFRGDIELLKPGLKQLEELTGIPVVGVVPYLYLDIEDEDSVTDRMKTRNAPNLLDIAVIRLPRISNFTDFNALEQLDGAGLRYVENVAALGKPDLIILPGTKNTMADLLWMRQNGLEASIKKLAHSGVPLLGICGGYQMLGTLIEDPQGVEEGGSIRGMELLPVKTCFTPEKVRTRVTGKVNQLEGYFSFLNGAELEGYEIHMGKTTLLEEAQGFSVLATSEKQEDKKPDGAVKGNVLGSYVHGLFDSGAIGSRLLTKLFAEKGIEKTSQPEIDYHAHKEKQYDLLADALREALDMELVYRILEGAEG